MKLLAWNINQRSSGQEIPGFVSKEILKPIEPNDTQSYPDIVVLTEFLSAANEENKKYIQMFVDGTLSDKYVPSYNIERKECEGSNGVLIAVKKEFKENDDVERISETKIISKIEKMNTVRTEQPNFLQVDMVVNGKLLSVIGTRIRVTGYNKRREQVLALIDHINKTGNKNIIIAGDFNNGKIYGDDSKLFYSGKGGVRESYHYTSRGEINDLYDTYNYHIMKEDFAAIGMTVRTPEGEQFSWGFNLNRNEKPDNGSFKEDHIITSKNITVIKESLKYSHKFIETYKKNVEWKLKNGSYYITNPYPDHAILTADVDFCS